LPRRSRLPWSRRCSRCCSGRRWCDCWWRS
jgi:hypothetical protein